MDAETYFEERLQTQIDWHEAKSGWNQKMFKRLQVVVIVAGALLPFLAGFQDQVPRLSWAIGALGILVAVVTGVLSLYRFQELWVDYRLTAESLQQEKYRFLTGVPPSDPEPAVAVLVDRVESVLAEQSSQWQQLTKEKQEAESDSA